MKVLVVGAGGREHALAWCLAKSPRITEVFVAPGNGGTAREPGVTNLPINEPHALCEFARREKLGFTVVGPEAPLADGIVDLFEAAGQRIFGPSQRAAQLEASKDFAKAFMARHDIPSAKYQTFTDPVAAHQYVDEQGAPIVVKADGLAAGKGVVVAQDVGEAHRAIDDMLIGQRMGQAGARVVIEDCLLGEEASFIALVDGKNVLALASSQDHKRLLDRDEGPNTGGMGAYSPAPVVSNEVHQNIMAQIIEPAVKGMAAEGMPFSGFLYAGVMIDEQGGLQTLEFNCRMGDPETQPILMRLKSDLADVLDAAIDGKLDSVTLDWDSRTAMGVVLAAGGYPSAPVKGDQITGLPSSSNEVGPNCMVFHAGTERVDQQTKTSGGRVMCVTALGDTVAIARANAYQAVEAIEFKGMQYRRDIGYRAISRDQ